MRKLTAALVDEAMESFTLDPDFDGDYKDAAAARYWHMVSTLENMDVETAGIPDAYSCPREFDSWWGGKLWES